MKVLGIETSCDETGIAIYDSDAGLVADALYSQVDIHRKYGGVVPELASRDHIRKTLPLVQEVMQKADCNSRDIDGLAYTAGPGLAGALLVGASIGRALGMVWNIPTIGVHHMEGHLLAPLLEVNEGSNGPQFPFIALLVSGGHTQLVQVEAIGAYTLIGESVDDAAGEAFDKVAKMLGLPYPGGPHIARLAEQGEAGRFTFPRPMTNRPGLDFSFSGLKTFTLNTAIDLMDGDTNTANLDQKSKADIAHAFQEAVVDTMRIKCQRAFRQSGLKTLVIAGGVSANRRLREVLADMAEKEGGKIYYPGLQYCTDNGAMIAYAGCQRLLAGQQDDLAIRARPRWPLEELSAI